MRIKDNLAFLTVCLLQLSLTIEETPWNTACPQTCKCSITTSLTVVYNMTTVDCSNGRANQIPEIPEKTQRLFLNGNRIKEIGNLPRSIILQDLDLSYNRLTLDYPAFDYLPSLLLLNLSHNHVQVLDEGVFSGLHALESIDLSHNEIITIKSRAFSGLRNLYKIYLSHNLLRRINHNWFPSVIYLQELYLDSNNITSLRGEHFGVLKYLDTISLAGNEIKRLEWSTFKGVSQLKSLNLSYNRLTNAPFLELSSLSVLHRLMLDGNPFKRLRKNDFYGSRLTEIHLSYMPELRLIENYAFNKMEHLGLLKINNNPKLFFIDRLAFYKLQNLREIYVDHNRLLGLSKKVVDLLPSLETVHIYNNPLTCDCNIRWIKGSLLTVDRPGGITFKRSDEITCYNPFNKTKLYLNHVPISNLSPVCSPTGIPLFQDDIQLEIGDALSLECYSMGSPTPQIKWILPDGTLVNQSTSRINISDINLLYLPDIRDDEAGTYACIVSNTYGYDISSTMIRVHTTTIRVEPIRVSKTFIRLTWSGSGMTVLSSRYRIVCRDVSTRRVVRELRLHQSIKYFTVSHLTPNTTYEFCVGYEHEERVNVLSCRNVTTLHRSYDAGGIVRVSKTNVVVATVSALLALVLLVIVAMFIKTKNRKDYAESGVAKDTTVHIPLTNMSLPPPTPLCTSRTSLLTGAQV